MVQYYSNITKEFYETEKDCLKAEKEHTDALRKKEEAEKKKTEQRKARAQEVEVARAKLTEVEVARAKLTEAKKNYDKLLADFCKDYDSYHYSITTPASLTDYLNELFNF